MTGACVSDSSCRDRDVRAMPHSSCNSPSASIRSSTPVRSRWPKPSTRRVLAGRPDVVPAFRSVAVYFDPLRTDTIALLAELLGGPRGALPASAASSGAPFRFRCATAVNSVRILLTSRVLRSCRRTRWPVCTPRGRIACSCSDLSQDLHISGPCRHDSPSPRRRIPRTGFLRGRWQSQAARPESTHSRRRAAGS